ncbi:MAG: hypothetical protein ACI84O_001378 [Myxococcota bacterium]|jgi:hypothetical protein
MFSLLGVITLFCCQQTAVEFEIELPSYFGEFTVNADASFSAKSTQPLAAVKVSRFEIGASGAFLDSVLKDIRQRQWQPFTKTYPALSIKDWRGKVSMLDGGGFEVAFNGSTILQRIAIKETLMVVISWEAPSTYAEQGRECLNSFVIPRQWLSTQLATSDMYQGNGPRGIAQQYPGTLAINVSLKNINSSKMMDFEVVFIGDDNAPEFKWQLPDFAVNVSELINGGIHYQLAANDIQDANSANGIFRFSENDVTAFDPLWLALPAFDSDIEYTSPAWQLKLEYAPHLIAVSAPMQKVELNESARYKESLTQIVPAGKSWPFFAVANYRSTVTNDFKWFLRLDSKSKLPGSNISELLRLDRKLSDKLGAHHLPFTVASFPYSGDRLFSGLLILDEDRGWFDYPSDSHLDDVSRRVLLARSLCQYRFGIECLGQGSAKLFLTSSLAEYLSYELLLSAGYDHEASLILKYWQLKEQQSGPLPQALSLLDVNDLYGSRRLLSFGSLVWRDIALRLGAEDFNKLCRKIYTMPGYSASDLLQMLQLTAGDIDVDWQKYFQRHIFGNQNLTK